MLDRPDQIGMSEAEVLSVLTRAETAAALYDVAADLDADAETLRPLNDDLDAALAEAMATPAVSLDSFAAKAALFARRGDLMIDRFPMAISLLRDAAAIVEALHVGEI